MIIAAERLGLLRLFDRETRMGYNMIGLMGCLLLSTPGRTGEKV
jgi:hypothetical protein